MNRTKSRKLAALTATSMLAAAFASAAPASSQEGPEPSVPAVVRGATWYLRNTADTGTADTNFMYGNRGDQKLMGDWDGDGTKTPAVYRDGTFYLRNSNDSGVADFTVEFYPAGPVAASPVVVIYPEVALAGDWNGDGIDGVGVFDNGMWDLFDPGETEADDEDFFFRYGNASDYPIAGDWDGDGSDTPGVVRGARWFLRNQNSTGVADTSFVYGSRGDIPVPADFDGDGRDGPTVVRGARWYVRNSNSTGVADRSFVYGNSGDIPLDWSQGPDLPTAGRSCEESLERVDGLGALGADCETARRVAAAYDAELTQSGNFPGSQPLAVADGWSCSSEPSAVSQETFEVLCDKGDPAMEAVTFIWGV